MNESKPVQFLYCYCCHQAYVRGKFKCCAPPSGMASHTWLEQFCNVEVSAGKFCRRCPRCGCEHRTKPVITGREVGMTAPSDIAPSFNREMLLKKFAAIDPYAKPKKTERPEWMPYAADREAGAEE